MDDPDQQWIRENQQRLERIRQRFSQFYRLSQSSSESEDDTEQKIENEWRKINDLLHKDIPNRMSSNPSVHLYKQLSYLKQQAQNIENQFKHKFGEAKLWELKRKENFGQWNAPVMKSGFRSSKPEKKEEMPECEEIPEEEEVNRSQSDSPNKKKKKQPSELSKIFKEYSEMDSGGIKKIKEGERKSYDHMNQVRRQYKSEKQWTIFMVKVIAIILCIILVLYYFEIDFSTGFLDSVLDL